MPNLIDLRRRVKSVTNTSKITKAMKMVSAAKLRKVQERMTHSRPFARGIGSILGEIAFRLQEESHPVFQQRPLKKVKLVVIAGDKGLCGSFNSNVFKKLHIEVEKFKADGVEVIFDVVGKRAESVCGGMEEIETNETFQGFLGNVTMEGAGQLAAGMAEGFTEGEVDAVYVIYNEFKNVMLQDVVSEQLLPVPQSHRNDDGNLSEHLFEPSLKEVLEKLIKSYLISHALRILLESSAAEHAARMTAMDAATNNCNDLIDQLVLDMNKARQTAITNELIEIVSGASAL